MLTEQMRLILIVLFFTSIVAYILCKNKEPFNTEEYKKKINNLPPLNSIDMNNPYIGKHLVNNLKNRM